MISFTTKLYILFTIWGGDKDTYKTPFPKNDLVHYGGRGNLRMTLYVVNNI